MSSSDGEERSEVVKVSWQSSVSNMFRSQIFPLIFANIFGGGLLLCLLFPGDWPKEVEFVAICFACVPLVIGIYNLGTESGDRRFVSFSLSALVLAMLCIIGVLVLH